MDWELKAKGLANDLRVLAVVAAVLGAGVAWEAQSWWAKAFGGYAVFMAASAFRSARIKE